MLGENLNPVENDHKRYNFRKSIVLLTGLPLSGKTTLAQNLAAVSNFKMLDVDEIRRELFAVWDGKPYENPDHESFAMITSYERMHELARDSLMAGNPVILVATYSRSLYLEMTQTLAARTDSPVRIFKLSADEVEVEKRINERPDDYPSAVKTLSYYHNVKDRYVGIDDSRVAKLDTGGPKEVTLRSAFMFLADLQV